MKGIQKPTKKKSKKARKKCRKPGNELRQKITSVKEMVNDKIELNFHVVS